MNTEALVKLSWGFRTIVVIVWGGVFLLSVAGSDWLVAMLTAIPLFVALLPRHVISRNRERSRIILLLSLVPLAPLACVIIAGWSVIVGYVTTQASWTEKALCVLVLLGALALPITLMLTDCVCRREQQLQPQSPVDAAAFDENA
jgi:hypothetical protein